MENSETFDENLDISVTANMLSSCSFKGSDVNIGNESVYYEKFLLDDLDNYWDELNDRLTVSRMVSDSVIKGMVHAVVEESDERIAAKEAEIEILNRKLQFSDNNSTTGSMSTSHHIESLDRLRSAAAGQIQKLKEEFQNSEIYERFDSFGTIVETMFEEAYEMCDTVKASMFEQQWEREFERDVNATIVKSSVRSLQDEFEKKLYEQRSIINQLNANWQQKVNELSSMREELDSISRSLSSSDSGALLSYNSLDSFEELSTSKRKDHRSIKENGTSLMKQSEDYEILMLEVADPSQLKHLSKDELFTHFKTEMINMRRQHDSALQEKTEEIFKLKREFLREKGSSPFKKDKDFELLKKKIPEVVIKLDGILLEKEKLRTVEQGYEEVCSLKQNIDFLLSENKRLRDLLREQRKEVKSLSSQISDAANQMSLHSSTEIKFLQQIKKLKGDLKDVKLEASIQSELHAIILKEVIGEKKCSIEELDVEASIAQDVYMTAVRGFISDGMSTINSIILKYFTEKSSLNALLCEKEKELCIEIEEKRKLNETIQSLSTLMKERENHALETGSTLMQHKEQFDMLNKEIDLLRERVTKQDELILSMKIEFDSMERRLVEALQQIRQNEMKIRELSGKLGVASDALEGAEKQKDVLHGIIEDKEKKILSFITKEKQQAKLMDSIVKSTVELSKALTVLENKLVDNIERNDARLKILSRQCRPLVRMANLLPKRALLYKQMLEIRSSNLQKAEAEVDLLGDEVDALLSLLGKIYIALDHYSPVLQHYPGVMEILKLVQRELEGETSR